MELKENKGIIFKNNKKSSENHPDYRGEINVKGEKYEIALWVKKGEKGSFFSVGISEPYKKAVEKPIDKEQIQDDTPVDSDGLPF